MRTIVFAIGLIITLTVPLTAHADPFTSWSWGTSREVGQNGASVPLWIDMGISNPPPFGTEPWVFEETWTVPAVPPYDGQVVGFYMDVESETSIDAQSRQHYYHFVPVCWFGIISEQNGSVQLGSTTNWVCGTFWTDLILVGGSVPYLVNGIQYSNTFGVNPGDSISWDVWQPLENPNFINQKVFRIQTTDQTTHVFSQQDASFGFVNGNWEINGYRVATGMQTANNTCGDIPAISQVKMTIRQLVPRNGTEYRTTPSPITNAQFNASASGPTETETGACSQASVTPNLQLNSFKFLN